MKSKMVEIGASLAMAYSVQYCRLPLLGSLSFPSFFIGFESFNQGSCKSNFKDNSLEYRFMRSFGTLAMD